jgi:hypothetical protein
MNKGYYFGKKLYKTRDDIYDRKWESINRH